MFISKKDYKVIIEELYYLRKRNILLEYIENSICISCNDICENRYKKPIDESCIKEYINGNIKPKASGQMGNFDNIKKYIKNNRDGILSIEDMKPDGKCYDCPFFALFPFPDFYFSNKNEECCECFQIYKVGRIQTEEEKRIIENESLKYFQNKKFKGICFCPKFP